jgi:pilus assembly protein CpaB
MKKNILFIIVFALLSSLFATLYLYDIGQKNKSMSQQVKVVVANQKIEQGKIITDSMLKEITVPKQYVQPKYMSSIKNFYIDNKPAYISVISFEEGEQITSSKVSYIASGFGLSNTIPNDKKAITLVFNYQEVNGIITSGSKVDLISVAEYENKNHNYEEASCVISQNILVLAVGNDIIGSVNNKNNEEQQHVSVNVPVTLAVSIQEAQKIFLAQEKGILKLVLRPTADEKIEDTKIIKIDNIYENAVSNTKNQSNSQSYLQMQKTQKELNEIMKKYSKK